MSQFDKTTREEAVSYGHTHADTRPAECGFVAGRNSVKKSLEILARAVHEYPCLCETNFICWKCKAIDEVKALGDWPLE